jgi:hypothetical protein
MTTELDVHAISGFSGDVTDCRRDVTETTAGHGGGGDTRVESSSGRVDKRCVSVVHTVAHDDRHRGVGYPAVDRRPRSPESIRHHPEARNGVACRAGRLPLQNAVDVWRGTDEQRLAI